MFQFDSGVLVHARNGRSNILLSYFLSGRCMFIMVVSATPQSIGEGITRYPSTLAPRLITFEDCYCSFSNVGSNAVPLADLTQTQFISK